MYSLYQICCFFVIYSFFGWCLEVIYEAVDHGRFVNRGFLNGPYCPIYGFGVIMVVSILQPISDAFIALYITSVILTSALEFITGFLLEKIFHQKWWDYSEFPFNIKGYICLKFSLLWGVACLIVMKLIHPLITAFVDWIPKTLGLILLAVILLAFIGDVIFTILGIMNIKKRLRLLQAIADDMKKISDFSGEKLYDAVAEIRKKTDEISDKNEHRRAKLDELKQKYKNAFNDKRFVRRRLEKAFPQLKATSGKSLREIIENLKKSDKR